MYICSKCKEECDLIIVDEGIGPYEYWGFKGCDVRYEAYSDCCGAPIIDEDGNEIDARDILDEMEAAKEMNKIINQEMKEAGW